MLIDGRDESCSHVPILNKVEIYIRILLMPVDLTYGHRMSDAYGKYDECVPVITDNRVGFVKIYLFDMILNEPGCIGRVSSGTFLPDVNEQMILL